MTSIYALTDPTDGRMRYVGKTSGSLRTRLSAHINDVRRGRVYIPRYKWIAKLLANGKSPGIVELERVDDRSWQAAERHWIKSLRADGCDLLNATEGGDGIGSYRHLDDTRRKQAEAAARRYQRPGERERTGVAVKAALNKPETVAKMRAVAARFTPEHRRRFRDGGTLYARTIGREVTRRIHAGKKLSDETKAKISIARTGKKRTAEAIKKSADGHRGKEHTPEHRAKISAGLKKYHAVTP